MSERHFDELIDSYIQYAGKELLLKLAEEAPSEEELESICDASDALDRMIMNIIDKEVEKRWLRMILSVAGKAAAIFLIFVTICAFAISGSKALRTQFIGLFMAQNEISLDSSFVKEEGENISRTVSVKDYIKPGFIPAGYMLKESSADGLSAASRYFNSDGGILTIERFSIGASHGIDNETTETYETEVMGRQAFVTETPDGNYLFFTTRQYEYSVSASLDIEVLMTIAEGLE